MIYFSKDDTIATAESNKNYSPVFRTDDLLGITVGGVDPETVTPFNLPITGLVNQNSGYLSGSPVILGYLIDVNGTIDFPVIGRIKIAGLNRDSAINLIKDKLKDYVKNPIINIRVMNFKITVLGEVKTPGTFNIPNERITLLEAIGLAGDLNITAKRKNIMIIRDVDGKKTETRIDLTSKELFSSSVFYLRQNDIIYIEPNRTKINSSALNTANVGIVVSVTSLLVTMVALFVKIRL
jgi:polysaccharide export outer membrane protein